MPNLHLVSIDQDEMIIDAEAHLVPSIVRQFTGATPYDRKIDSLPIPLRPFWLRQIVRSIRIYRRLRPASVGNRCVFDPSCSRYAEWSFREFGFFSGIMQVAIRLARCRNGNGGVDLPKRDE